MLSSVVTPVSSALPSEQGGNRPVLSLPAPKQGAQAAPPSAPPATALMDSSLWMSVRREWEDDLSFLSLKPTLLLSRPAARELSIFPGSLQPLDSP